MLGKNFLLGTGAIGILAWRLIDPKGSYATLFDISHLLTEAFAGYEVITRLVSMVLVDQFNGLVLGIAFTAFLYAALGAIRQAATWPLRYRRRMHVPLSRYTLPKRVSRLRFA